MTQLLAGMPMQTWQRHRGEFYWPDPFTALVEADRWYKEHVEKSPNS